MDGVRDLVTQSSGKLLCVLHEVKERIHNIHVAAGSCESVRLRFVNQIKPERVVVARLRRLRNGIGNRLQLVVQWGGFDDFALRLQLVEDLLAHLHFFVLVLARLFIRSGTSASAGAGHRTHEGREGKHRYAN